MDGRELVALVQAAARRHGVAWSALVPDAYRVNHLAEAAEEEAYAELAHVRHALRDHIYETYGISLRELCRLAAH